jgi:hypothetical protein
MRSIHWMISALPLAGCQPGTEPMPHALTTSAPIPELVEPSTFSAWPKVTDRPVHVGPELGALCRLPTPDEARARDAKPAPHGPHAGGSIVVRVSPETLAQFRAGDPLPSGAAVVKEKHALTGAPPDEYAAMGKREAGHDPRGGDREYAYVTLVPERKVTRGRLAECAGCHVSARGRDYLFRSYSDGRR